MAALATMTMGDLNEERKQVYPLFQKGAKPRDTKPKIPEPQPDSHDASTNVSIPQSEDVPKKAPRKSTKKTKTEVLFESSNAAPMLPAQEAEHGQAELLEVDPNNSRRKRRKTDSPGTEGLIKEATEATFPKKKGRPSKTDNSSPSSRKAPATSIQTIIPVDAVPAVINGSQEILSSISDPGGCPIGSENGTINNSSASHPPPLQDDARIGETNILPAVQNAPTQKSMPKDAGDGKPKKILRLNPKTGTIGSPPAKKSFPPIETITRGSARGKAPKSRIVTIHYGPSERLPSRIGHKIEQIMNDTKPAPPLPQTAKPPPAQPPKALHPLFMGKAAPKEPPPEPEAAEKASGRTMVDLTGPATLGRARIRSIVQPSSPPKPRAAFAGFGKSSMILKFPGAVEPAWPWAGMVHLRGNNESRESLCANDTTLQTRPKPKKSKYQAIQISSDEDVIASLANDLSIKSVVENIREINPDEFPPLPPCLRLPTKHYEGGSALQQRVRKELLTKLSPPKPAHSDSSDDEIQTNRPARSVPHPALSRVYNLIPQTLSYFDKGQCETQSWTQKYSPKTAADVLQSGREALILKEWLQKLTVQSVETGPGDKATSRASSVTRTGPKSENAGKRKRKSKKLDGFVISSDEEDNAMDEITDPEDNVVSDADLGFFKKTVIRAGDAAKGSKEPGRVTNAVVISGPHGCGKTAAVYAIAKELGFEVFEINSSSRRSGKDILEKVGDMTRNHLVQRSQAPLAVNEDEKRVDDALAHDLQSGRQDTMESFFKPKETAKPKIKPAKPKPAPKEEIVEKHAPKPAPKQQKQSLILIEEADILYDADRGFWSTILELISQSKRPIIITCNDESVLPMDALTLYAVVRFVPPPIDLATDYMLLVAACEGHIIERGAVKTLYEGRNMDLRASLTDLNFWCQFAVGDLKGGLDWFYPRWRPGSDIDAKGETIRVVSENTYEAGMGWLSQDVLESHVHHLDIEEEVLHEAWDGWHLDIGDWQKTIDIGSWAKDVQKISVVNQDQRFALRIHEDFAASMSEADLFSGGLFAPDNQTPLDVNMPALSTKVREDYILAHQLIEASPLVDFTTTSKDISLWMKSRARKYLQVDQHIQHGFEVPTQLDRPSEKDVLRLITKQATTPDPSLSRRDFSLAFDPISEVEKYVWNISTTLEASSFDRDMAIISTDLAPYIRSIVAYDARLQEERTRMSNMLSEGGGRKGKRMRTTRAAMSALEGGARSTTRRDRYFTSKLNSQFVLQTGMQSWLDAALREEKAEREFLRAAADVAVPKKSEEGGSERDEST